METYNRWKVVKKSGVSDFEPQDRTNSSRYIELFWNRKFEVQNFK